LYKEEGKDVVNEGKNKEMNVKRINEREGKDIVWLLINKSLYWFYYYYKIKILYCIF
jgi:hypothetical protein